MTIKGTLDEFGNLSRGTDSSFIGAKRIPAHTTTERSPTRTKGATQAKRFHSPDREEGTQD